RVSKLLRHRDDAQKPLGNPMISSSTTHLSIPIQRYKWGWLLAIVAGFAALGYIVFVKSPIPLFNLETIGVSAIPTDSYLILRMPSIPSNNALMVERADEWFSAMKSHGYRAMLLSQIYGTLKSGKGIPENTVVLLYDPGYRQTFDVVSPLLAKYKFPAVWITDAKATAEGDRRFVSAHTLDAMKRSGDW